jgi:glycine betaine/proline transport system substrate-binding protein
MGEMPGEGKSVRLGRATWDTGWFQAELFGLLIEDLGYDVEMIPALPNDAFYLSCARGDVDMWANGWFPIHNVYIEDSNIQGKVEIVGTEVEAGALQGYLMDKATSDTYGITSISQLADPELAALFDSDGNGKANLVGCPEGWGCARVINHQIEAYGLEDTVEHVQGDYALLMVDVLSRYQRGEPVLFYTWTPNWTVNKLKPGEDVVWLEVDTPSLPEDQAEMVSEELVSVPNLEGCASSNNPCMIGWIWSDIRVVANSEFLDDNPAVRNLAEAVEIPFEDINEQNAWMEDNEARTEEEIRAYALSWVGENRALVDEWLQAARGR